MEPYGAAAGGKRLHTLRQQAGGHAGEDIAAAALCYAVIAGGVHRQMSVRRGDHRPVPLQHQIDAPACGVGRRTALPSPAHVAAHAEELPLVGRQHRHKTAAAGQLIYMPFQRVYAIGIQHQRLLQRQQAAHQPVALLAASHAASHSHGIAPGGAAADLRLRRQTQLSVQRRQRVGHGLVGLHRRHLPDVGWDAQKDQSAAGADGGTGAEHRRAGVAHAAAQHIDLSEIPLVTLRVAAGQGGAHMGGVQRQHRSHSFSYFLFSISHLSIAIFAIFAAQWEKSACKFISRVV